MNEKLSIDKTRDIEEPPCPSDEHRFKGCLALVNEELVYYINRRCKARFLWLFWFNYAESPYYEDPSLENAFYRKLTNRADWVPYSETIIIKPEDTTKREQEYPKGYRQSAERLDFYVTKPEFSEAYRAVQKLGRRRGTGKIREVTILITACAIAFRFGVWGVFRGNRVWCSLAPFRPDPWGQHGTRLTCTERLGSHRPDTAPTERPLLGLFCAVG